MFISLVVIIRYFGGINYEESGNCKTVERSLNQILIIQQLML